MGVAHSSQLTPEVAHLLDVARGPVEAPIRAVLFGQARFEQHGHSLADTHEVVDGSRSSPFFPRLDDNLYALRNVTTLLDRHAREGLPLGPAASWLLDNASLIEEQLRAIRSHLPRRYFRRLPVLRDEPLAGLPRIYGVVWAWVAHTDSSFDAALLESYLRAYQQRRQLTLAELWALPTTMRAILVENLRRVAEHSAAVLAVREWAHAWVDDATQHAQLSYLEDLHARLGSRALTEAFALPLQQRLEELPADAQVAVTAWLTQHLGDPAAALARQQAEAAADHQTVRNAITSLRQIDQTDWRVLIGHVSAVMQALRANTVYCDEAERTQDDTLHAVEQLARESGRSELEVAQALVALPRADDPPQAQAPAWAWDGPGRRRLRAALGLQDDARARLGRALRTAGPALYVGGVTLASVALVLAMLQAHPVAGWLQWLAFIVLLGPASEAVVTLVHRVISELARPRQLPRLALAGGIPAAHQTLVVLPTLLSSTATVAELLRQLQRHHLANREAHTQFALLSDWGDADGSTRDDDAALLQAARSGIEQLNLRHPTGPGQRPRFLLLHRARSWSPGERRFIGWERKRGKIEMLMRAIVEPGYRPFIALGSLTDIAPGTRHVLTLDADTGLPPGRLRELVAIAAHPLNQPQLDARGRVVAGFGILQPRVVTPLPTAQESTGFHALFNGHNGIDPYSAASSEIYQDLFDEGSYSGKGLLDVQALHAALGGRLPEGLVLSHDLLEGNIARCARVSDVTIVEQAPPHPDVAASRLHRWTRGDWQLLPFVLRPRRWGIGFIGWWKMFDNLRRSLVAPLSLAALVLALLTPLPVTGVLALVFVAFAGGPLLGAIAGLLPSRPGIVYGLFLRRCGADVLRALAVGAWHIVQLLAATRLSLDAIGRALWRMAVSRRHLLEWTTAAAAQAAARQDLPGLLRRHAGVPLTAAALFGALLALRAWGVPVALHWAAALCTLWALAPLATAWAARPLARLQKPPLAGVDGDYLHGVARNSWSHFEAYVGAEDNHLPPDNVQTLPHVLVAHRTSPTNIGLYLLTVACAREFGWIGSTEMAERLEATLRTLERLPRHLGHFFNWYDTRSLAVLPPAYVSTVDSGNLSACLLAVAGACDACAQAGAEQPQRLSALAARLRLLAWAPSWLPLFDARRALFHIGLNADSGQLDGAHYDLLASEARLTSLVAIAKGEVPARHWAMLGRPLFGARGLVGLRSWSGSMFEYLMPSLLLHEPAGGLLHQALRSAVAEHQRDGARAGTPWGISECAYAGQDHTLAYQYGPQGVARLALRRTPPDERVVAPYATLLAALVDAPAAVANLRELEALGARGPHGFIEALDFTPERQTDRSRVTPVATVMSHHQGMALVALTAVLKNDAPRRWAMADAHLDAVSPLLHEHAPREAEPLLDPVQSPLRRARAQRLEWSGPAGVNALAPTQLLGNGRYAVMLRDNGAGWSQWQDVGITRWRDDVLRDAHGSFFFVQRGPGAALQSITQHPAPDAAAEYHTRVLSDRVQFDASWPDLHSRCEVWVSPEDDVELRRVTLHNHGTRPIVLTLHSYFEATLSTQRADEAHPAFANLFVQCRWQPQDQALYLQRRPRLAGEPEVHAVHFIAGCSGPIETLRGAADRARWIGRWRTLAGPLAHTQALPDAALELQTGLDPVAALALQLHLEPQAQITVTFGTAAAAAQDTLEALVDQYRQPAHVERAADMSYTMAAIRLRERGIDADHWNALLLLNTALTSLLARELPPAPQAAGDGLCNRRQLWRFGISGDQPLLVVWLADPQGLPLAQALVRALHGYTHAGLALDLVLVNAESASYLTPVHDELLRLQERHKLGQDDSVPQQRRARLHLLQAADLDADTLRTLHALARLWLRADGRPLPVQLQRWAELHEAAEELREEVSVTPVTPMWPLRDVPPQPPQGRFDGTSGAFEFTVGGAQQPPRPWVNVLANGGFGTQVSESLGGYTWAGNSRMQQLTPWHNDPVSDAGGETLLLQDLDTHRVWRLGSASDVPQQVGHQPGLTRVLQLLPGLEVELRCCVDSQAAVKQTLLQLRSTGTGTRRLRVVALAEWVLGSQRSERQTLHTARLGAWQALLATQQDAHAGFGGSTAWLVLQPGPGCAADAADWTCDRREFFDARGRMVLPDQLGRHAGSGLDACAALGLRLRLGAGAGATLAVLLGHAASADAAPQAVQQALATPPQQREQRQLASWQQRQAAVSVSTPDPLFDALVNRWLPYQTLACRLWARAGFYQAGGAFGFRDQLQDAASLLLHEPALLRAQLLLAATRQFPEGDVQHWWHMPGGAGVRTHFSDDLLWLPWACAAYVDHTGDAALLDESLPFLEGSAVPAGAEDIYETPRESAQRASLYEHCARTLDHSMATGAHGLPLMGSGDWNDGMNRVGHQGRGESVWLAWFLCRVVRDFTPLAAARGDTERVHRWTLAQRGWQRALEQHGWDGAWYRRAFFDDGSPLGSAANAECRIDLIAQAWAVLSEAAEPQHATQALDSARRLLVDGEHRLVKLLDPPLRDAVPSAGYIQAYPPGVRENGGQYNHGAVWALMAFAQRGDAATAWQLFQALSPAHRSADAAVGAAYGIEPYVMAGDIYTQPPYVGRGGWSWYTGSAGWLLHAALQSLLGVRLRRGRLQLQPCLPPHWPQASVTLLHAGRRHRVVVCADERAAVQALAAAGPASRRRDAGVDIDLDALPDGSVHVVTAAARVAVAA